MNPFTRGLLGRLQSPRMAVTIVDEPTPTIIEIGKYTKSLLHLRLARPSPSTRSGCAISPIGWSPPTSTCVPSSHRRASPRHVGCREAAQGSQAASPCVAFRNGNHLRSRNSNCRWLRLSTSGKRLVERFGEPVEDLRMFPRPESIAGASLDELRACGLSRQKTDYVRAFAQRVSGAG